MHLPKLVERKREGNEGVGLLKKKKKKRKKMKRKEMKIDFVDWSLARTARDFVGFENKSRKRQYERNYLLTEWRVNKYIHIYRQIKSGRLKHPWCKRILYMALG